MSRFSAVANWLGRERAAAAQLPLLTVTGSQRPYIYDLPHLLSLPIGFEFRFRYRHRWVDKTILDTIARNAQAYVGRSIVVIFHSQDNKRVVPIRLATILGIEAVGPMIFVRFRAGEFFRVDLDIASYSYASSKDSDDAGNDLFVRAKGILGTIDNRESFDFAGPLPIGWYLREAACSLSDSDLDRGDPIAAWARMVAVLHGERSLSGIPFFYLMGFRTEEGSVVRPESILNRFSPTREAIDGFPLRESRRYRMRVAEWCEPPKDIAQRPVLINCEFNHSQFSLEGSSNLVVGRYDVIEFTFSCLQPGYSEMALRAEPVRHAQNTPSSSAAPPTSTSAQVSEVTFEPSACLGKPAAAPWDTWPAIFVARVPVVVKAKATRTVLSIASLLVGLSLYLVLAPKIGARFGDKWKGIAELSGLGILYFGYGTIVERLDRLFKLGRGLRRLSGGPTEWEQTDKD